MATVTCRYCKKKFDREKMPYIQIPYGEKTFRYAHSECYLEAVNNGQEKNHYEIYDPKKFTNCFWCSQAILPTDPNVELIPDLLGRYAHKKCNSEYPKDDRDKFKIFLIKLYQFKDDYAWPGLMQQAERIAKQYKYTYSGMMKALEYFYKVKHNPVDRSKGIGIIPYVYKQAYEYYYALWIASEQNKQKDLTQFIPKDYEVVIRAPERKPEQRKLFTFLDEEGDSI